MNKRGKTSNKRRRANGDRPLSYDDKKSGQIIESKLAIHPLTWYGSQN
ncbi:MAG: hypothetical protein LBQ77_06755 [Treponema sp.]|nr:hypothetical protein [Treponema sp.]